MAATVTPAGQSAVAQPSPATMTTTPSSAPANTQTATPLGVGATVTTMQSAREDIDVVGFFGRLPVATLLQSNPVHSHIEALRDSINPERHHTVGNAREFFDRVNTIAANAAFADAIRAAAIQPGTLQTTTATITPTWQPTVARANIATMTTPPPPSIPVNTPTATPTEVGATATIIQSAPSASEGCCAQMKNFFQGIIDTVWDALKSFSSWVGSFFAAAEQVSNTPRSLEGFRDFINPEANHTREEVLARFMEIPEADRRQIGHMMFEIAAAANPGLLDSVGAGDNRLGWAHRILTGPVAGETARDDVAAHFNFLAPNSLFRRAIDDVIQARREAAQTVTS